MTARGSLSWIITTDMNWLTNPFALAWKAKNDAKSDRALLKEKCAYCDEPMYTVVRAHHHTEIINGKEQDVTK